MKLIAPLLALTLAGASALAQTTAPAAPAKPAAKPAATVHHTGTTAAHHTTAAHPAADADEALPPNVPKVPGVKQTLYALKYIDISVGTGPLAEPQKWYTVHYTGYLAKDGTKFDSSVDRGSPITFPYGAHQVITGWDTAFQGMHIGGKRRIFIPYQLAYGDAGRPPVIPAKADLIFDVELIAISDKAPTPPAPPAAPAKPAGAADSKPATPPDNKPASATPPEPATKPAPQAAPAKPETK